MESELRRVSLPETATLRTRSTPAIQRVLERGAIVGARWRFLAEASTALDSSLEYTKTLTSVVHLVVPKLADYAAIALLADDGSLTWGFCAHCDPAKEVLAGRLTAYQPRMTTEDDLIAEALRSGEPQIVRAVDDATLLRFARDSTHLSLLRQLAPTSVIILPLAAHDRMLGSLVLATTRDSVRRFGDRDILIANEVGRRVALAVDRALLFRAAEQAARARELMMAVVSHDLKNPLSTIQMAVSFLLEDLLPDDADHQREIALLRVMRRSGETMHRLIHDLLDVAAIEGGQLAVSRSSLAVDVLVSDALELLNPLAAAKSITLVTELSPTLPDVAADRERVLQVFSNVGGNAVKFTPEGGRIEIRAALSGALVEFAVRDTGPGIAHEDLPHVFDRFWQARKKARSGAGLGLAIAKGIVDAHGGCIRVDNEPGGGSCFRFTLPVASP